MHSLQELYLIGLIMGLILLLHTSALHLHTAKRGYQIIAFTIYTLILVILYQALSFDTPLITYFQVCLTIAATAKLYTFITAKVLQHVTAENQRFVLWQEINILMKTVVLLFSCIPLMLVSYLPWVQGQIIPIIALRLIPAAAMVIHLSNILPITPTNREHMVRLITSSNKKTGRTLITSTGLFVVFLGASAFALHTGTYGVILATIVVALLTAHTASSLEKGSLSKYDEKHFSEFSADAHLRIYIFSIALSILATWWVMHPSFLSILIQQ